MKNLTLKISISAQFLQRSVEEILAGIQIECCAITKVCSLSSGALLHVEDSISVFTLIKGND